MSRRFIGVSLALAAMLTLSQSASAQFTDYTWTGAVNGNWTNGGNWSENSAPVSGPDANLIFSGGIGTTNTNDFGGGFQLSKLTIDSTGTPNLSWIINGNPLTFVAATDSTQPSLDLSFTAGDASLKTTVINAPITVNTGTTLTLTVSSAITATTPELILNGMITGGGTISRTSAGLGTEFVINSKNNTDFTGTYNNVNTTALTGVNALGRGAKLNTGGAATDTINIGNTSANLTAPAGTNALGVGGVNQQVGSIAGAGTLQIGFAGSPSTLMTGFTNAATSLTGLINATNSGSHLAKVGTGTWTLTGASGGSGTGSTLQGGISVRDGSITVSGTGASLGTSNVAPTTPLSLSVYSGSSIVLTTGSTTTSRVQDNASVAGNGGLFHLNAVGLASSATGFIETVGTLNIASGQSTVQVSISNNRQARLHFSGLTQAGTASLFVNAPNLGVNAINSGVRGGQIAINAAGPSPALFSGTTPGYIPGNQTLQILPFAFATTTLGTNPNTFVAYDATNVSLRGLEDNDYSTSLGASALNVSLASVPTLGGATTANALRLTTGGGVNIGGNTLTISSGALLNTAASATISNGSLQFSNTAFITTNNQLFITAAITAPNISKNGAGTLNVDNITLTNAAPNTIAVNAGTLNITGSVTASGQPLTYSVYRGASLQSTNAISVGSNQIIQGGGTQTTGATNTATIAANINVNNGGTIRASSLGGNNAALASPGVLNVSGNVAFNGGGTYEWYANSVLGSSTTGGVTTHYTQGLINSTGSLDLSSLSAGNRFNIKVTTLKLDNTLGAIYDYDGTNRTFTIASFAGGITGFDASKFNLQYTPTDFSGNSDTILTLTADANNLYLNASTAAIPEPMTTLAIAAGSLGLMGLVRRRMNRKAVPTVAV